MDAAPRSLVAAMTIVSMSWFDEFSRTLGLTPREGQDLTGWARNHLERLEASELVDLTWREHAELEERHLRPQVESAAETRGGLVVRYLDRLLAVESAQLDPLNDWLLAFGVLADSSRVDDETLDRVGAKPLRVEFLSRCPEALVALLSPLRLQDQDQWDALHDFIWEPKYGLETSRVWDGIHPPLVSSLLLHDAPGELTSGDSVRRIADHVIGKINLAVGIEEWPAIRVQLGL